MNEHDVELKPVVIPVPCDILAHNYEYEHPTIQELVYDPEYRALFVESLRAAAALLRGDAPFDADSVVGTEVRFKVAKAILEAAQGLCDHTRTHGMFCRYCEVVLSQPKSRP